MKDKSSVEAKYRAMALGVCELLWIRKVTEELDFTTQGPLLLYSDSKAKVVKIGILNEIEKRFTKSDCKIVRFYKQLKIPFNFCKYMLIIT